MLKTIVFLLPLFLAACSTATTQADTPVANPVTGREGCELFQKHNIPCPSSFADIDVKSCKFYPKGSDLHPEIKKYYPGSPSFTLSDDVISCAPAKELVGKRTGYSFYADGSVSYGIP